MFRKKSNNEEPHNTDRWLLTYADLITLLLGLFVILYAMSKIDAERYTKIVMAMSGVFGSSDKVFTGSKFDVREPLLSEIEIEKKLIQGEINAVLESSVKSGLVSVNYNERGITVHLMEELLFETGKAEIKNNSLAVLDSLAEILRTLPNEIRVEGHTDNVPINTARFPSNWHLSVERAVATAYYLITRHKLTAEKISVAGYSEYHPIAPNDTPANRARNRRVDIVIVTNIIHENNVKEKQG